jgi:hypothetical protein
MLIKPKYKEEVLKNPYYSGIIVGYLVATGICMFVFVDIIYGLGLCCVGLSYYYKKNKEFNSK